MISFKNFPLRIKTAATTGTSSFDTKWSGQKDDRDEYDKAKMKDMDSCVFFDMSFREIKSGKKLDEKGRRRLNSMSLIEMPSSLCRKMKLRAMARGRTFNILEKINTDSELVGYNHSRNKGISKNDARGRVTSFKKFSSFHSEGKKAMEGLKKMLSNEKRRKLDTMKPPNFDYNLVVETPKFVDSKTDL